MRVAHPRGRAVAPLYRSRTPPDVLPPVLPPRRPPPTLPAILLLEGRTPTTWMQRRRGGEIVSIAWSHDRCLGWGCEREGGSTRWEGDSGGQRGMRAMTAAAGERCRAGERGLPGRLLWSRSRSCPRSQTQSCARSQCKEQVRPAVKQAVAGQCKRGPQAHRAQGIRGDQRLPLPMLIQIRGGPTSPDRVQQHQNRREPPSLPLPTAAQPPPPPPLLHPYRVRLNWTERNRLSEEDRSAVSLAGRPVSESTHSACGVAGGEGRGRGDHWRAGP